MNEKFEDEQDQWPEMTAPRIDYVRVVTDPRVRPGNMMVREGKISHVYYELVSNPMEVEAAMDLVATGEWRRLISKTKAYEEEDDQ